MKQKESELSRSLRMYEIIQLLRSARGPMTAQAISEALEVSKRTAYRDIAALQSMRVPIDGEAGVGYIMRPGFDLPPMAFSSEEIEAIIVGLALLRRTGDTGLLRAARQVAKKISDVVPSQAKAHFDKKTLHVSGWNAIPSSDIKINRLRRAIRDEEKLNLSYTDLEDNYTQRTILPLAIVYYTDAIILAAWCELRVDFRHFRIDRSQAFEPTGEFFCDRGDNLRKKWQALHDLP